MKSAYRSLGILFLPIFAFLIGLQIGSDMKSDMSNAPVQIEKGSGAKSQIDGYDVNTILIEEIIDTINEKYVDVHSLDKKKLNYGIAKGIIYSLDDIFSDFMTPDESNDFQDTLDGSLEGIGAELTMRNGLVMVVSPIRGSPASRSGLLPQDIIIKVDDNDVSDKSLTEIVSEIRGEPGTSVKLTIIRKGQEGEMEIEIIRERIVVESVALDIKGNIALIEVRQFGTNTKEEFEKYLSKALLKDIDGVIIDLRFNSGGYLEKARDIVSCFVDEGKVVTIKSKDEVRPVYVSGEKKTSLPLVLLQNGGSASASEIVAGALQDMQRATIVGSQSFGKGTVQEIIPLRNGGKLRLTIAKWFTPDDRNINGEGITPDVVVENTTEDYANNRDPQLDKAIEVLNEMIKKGAN
ncbi:MAG: S41 family peptidase [Candidatus Gracilibacteria bacterium]|jgi:carboxyl-terminal processing protease|nr:S41 family peptidase [Candidatus Gracilibacteria bacterium]